MKRLAIAGILVATVATAVLSASAGAASDWNYVAKPPYVQGPRLSAGASHTRIMNSWSRRCMMKGTQASPLSTHTSLSFGKRSGRPLITQLVR